MTTPFPDDDGGLEIGGIPIQQFYEKLVVAGLPKSTAGQVVGIYLDKHPGITKRTFAYTTSVPSGTGCTAKFQRTFTHTDWKDGRDVVQAEETTLEEGFNRRFHRIENDLDALDVDATQAFTCLNTLRTAVTTMFAEVKAELNRINADVAVLDECCEQHTGPTLNQDLINQVKYGGTTIFKGNPVHLFHTAQGIITLPVVADPPQLDARVLRAAELGRYTRADSALMKFLGEGSGHTKKEILEKFGGVKTDGGWQVSELLAILPDSGERYRTVDHLVKEVAVREAGALRTELAGDEAELYGLVGGPATGIGVEYLGQIPERSRDVLEQEGVKTIGDFLKLDAKRITALMKRRGVDVSPTDVAGWRAGALVLSNLR